MNPFHSMWNHLVVEYKCSYSSSSENDELRYFERVDFSCVRSYRTTTLYTTIRAFQNRGTF